MAQDRVWYRSRTTGDRGYVVQDGERARIRLDRPSEEITKPFIMGEWIEEVEVRNFTPMQMAQVAHVADRLLCTFLGLHTEAKLDWISLREQVRIKFMKEGPVGSASSQIRQELFAAIMAVLRRYC
jgi:hypothetical protein